MASRLRDGFDFYSAVTEGVGDIWTTFASVTFSATTRFSAGQAVQTPFAITSGTNVLAGALNANCTTLFWNFAYMKATAVGASVTAWRMKFLDGATVQCSIGLNQDGSLVFYNGDGGTVLGTYTGAMTGGGTWNHFQIKIVFSGSVGSFEVRKDSNLTASFLITGLNNIVTANAYANSVVFACAHNFPDTYSMDDFWIFDDVTSGVEPTTWIGDVRAVQIMPSADSAVQFTPDSGANNYSRVNELTNNNANYVTDSVVGHVDEYSNAGFGSAPSGILGVTVKQTASVTGGARTMGARFRSGATVLDSAGKNITGTVVKYSFNQDTDPNTSAAWTAANLAAAKFGPKIVS